MPCRTCPDCVRSFGGAVVKQEAKFCGSCSTPLAGSSLGGDLCFRCTASEPAQTANGYIHFCSQTGESLPEFK